MARFESPMLGQTGASPRGGCPPQGKACREGVPPNAAREKGARIVGCQGRLPPQWQDVLDYCKLRNAKKTKPATPALGRVVVAVCYAPLRCSRPRGVIGRSCGSRQSQRSLNVICLAGVICSLCLEIRAPNRNAVSTQSQFDLMCRRNTFEQSQRSLNAVSMRFEWQAPHCQAI